MAADLTWLFHPVPLWALLLALLTAPYLWSRRIAERVGPLLDRVLPTDSGGD